MNRFKSKTLCCWLGLAMFHLQAANVDDVRGALLYNLSKVVTFPELNRDEVTLCAYPESAGIIHFFQQKGTLQSQGKPFQLQVLKTNQDPISAFCQMLYLEWPQDNSRKDKLPGWSNSMMTISHDPDFLLSGGLMTLATSDNRMLIMMNKNSLKQSSVAFPSRVLKLATWYP